MEGSTSNQHCEVIASLTLKLIASVTAPGLGLDWPICYSFAFALQNASVLYMSMTA